MPSETIEAQNEWLEKPASVRRPLPIRLNEWLSENKARLLVRVQTPRGELITPENFVPAGWALTIDVVSSEAPK